VVPYVHKRVPKWSETDGAQIVYTARFVDYALDAIEGWFRDVLRVDWFLMNTQLDMGTPFVKIDMDIKSPLTPHDELEVRVLVGRLGRSSFTFDVVGIRNGSQISFESEFVCSMVRKSTMRSISIPDDLRQRAQDYMSACAEAEISVAEGA
jgi:YbgC/YbaW family acyl-CoA thioester hydrolase